MQETALFIYLASRRDTREVVTHSRTQSLISGYRQKLGLGKGAHTEPTGESHMYLVSLGADWGAKSAVRHEVLTVVPQEAVGSQTQKLLRPLCHLFVEQRLPLEGLVQVIDQDVGSVGEVLHCVHADAGHPADDAQDETLVGDHLLRESLVVGQGQQDVGHHVGDTVVAQVDAIVGQVGPGHLQHVSAQKIVDLIETVPRLVFARRARTEELEAGDEEQFLQQEGQHLQHWVLHPAGKRECGGWGGGGGGGHPSG